VLQLFVYHTMFVAGSFKHSNMGGRRRSIGHHYEISLRRLHELAAYIGILFDIDRVIHTSVSMSSWEMDEP
jgi:hypothetical protein